MAPASARRNDSFSAAQQLAQSISSTETPEAAVTEGAQLEEGPNLFDSAQPTEHAPVSILEAATKIARDKTAAHNAKLAVLRVFSESFEQAAKQFTSGTENSIAKQVATKFLKFWTQSLAELEEPPKPTYSSVLASGKPKQGQLAFTASAPPQRKPQTTTRLPGRPPVAPPKEDLRVFVRLDADAPARNHERYAIRTHIAARVGIDLRRIPAAFPVNTGWAIQASDVATRDLLVQRQAEWAADLEAAAVEISQKWHSYVVADCPRRLTDLRGVVINYEEAVKEEIACQTGLKPISIRLSRHDSGDMPTQTLIVSFLEPTRRPWRLFGASRLARYIDKPSIPSQCDKCWDFHARHSCDRMARCRRCGKTNHRSQECAALEQCANCLGPHCADDPKCPARPKRVHGIVRRLTKEEKGLVRQAGAQLFAQQKRQTPNHNVPEQSCQSPDSTNVGKIPPAHDTALALADSERYDIILLQEPWTGLKDGRCLTKTHPAYDTFSPVTDWDGRDTRPRVMTYVRRSAGLVADQKRPPDYDAALEILLGWCATDKCLVSGDFNAKHPSWQAGRQEHRGEDIAFWAMDNRLSLLNAVDVPTNARGSTIDLAFSNIPLADASSPSTLPLCKIRLNSDEELKRFVELVEAGAAFIPTTTSTPSELDNFASALVDLLGCAARAAGRPVRKMTHGARWWNEECAKAAANYRAWRRVYPLGFDREVQLAKRELHNAVRRAKRLYWRDLIDSFADGDSVFRAVRWLKSSGPCQAPPASRRPSVRDAAGESHRLAASNLERRTASDDIPDPWIPARDATLRTGNTSPGSDNITVRMLRAVWHAIGSLVHQLYQGCLTIGHHPKPFREAEVVMIAKLGRRDLSTPRAWRPISLLSCLGKGLERLIARRLAWGSIHFGVLHPQQAGALPKRSAVDLVAALVHDIEEAFARKQVATLVTLDIQGAFDTVICNRLVLRLREQGWPSNLARWAGSFMQDRSARIRYQDIVTDSSPSSAGRFGYADDTAILCLLSWGAANGISFDPDKTEVMHFSRTKPKTAPPVLHGEFEKRPDRAMRWLGVWLDSSLSFKTHVEKWTAKAQAVAFHLRRLTNTKHGPLPSAMRRAVCACVIPVLLYAAEAWYPGPKSPRWTKPSKEGPSGIGNLVKKMSKALYTSLRAILPVWRTTPTNVLHTRREYRPFLYSSKGVGRPLLRALKLSTKLTRSSSARRDQKLPLRRADEMLSSCPRPALLQRGFAEEQTAPLQSASKHETAKKFRDWLQALSPRTLVVYSDGSRSEEGHIGYGYAVHRDGSTVLSGKGRLGTAEVFDAEAKGALEVEGSGEPSRN
ncbi:reverse transcriptase (RNA-dependent DNA polymerase) domain-containing protein [Hirsutella rhossiliensis]|uniref:Reverse transcriptase (RNA-dependent DNA polymerase) domain-containing protein n=1 Tax=Hirsutella rhossiliensis TaxID=111463 RepID=A0A9P8MWI7_9HYPO|nr:reverse transcriptase (RNA-dependent DNA polymerase) domain-containing protein [Hirsutella rhossiliensis]KAH0962575.1 reverse transcriptase (RNA-dependent DNA polymerase) domain-containing protein [Hirsutella rhossiliensis]